MDIFQFFTDNEIKVVRVDHPPVFTCEEAERLVPDLPACDMKNIFVKDKKGSRHFLIVTVYHKSIDLKQLSKLLDVRNLSLASPERLKKHLGVDPGAVSILGVVHDTSSAVEVIIDDVLWKEAAFCCHPLVNTSTVIISKEDIEKILRVTQHSFRVIPLPGRNPA